MRDRLDTLRRAWSRVPVDVRRALPYGIVMALALGLAVVMGAHLSNATPSSDRPFGWPGPAAFENAVVMVRKDIVLAATLPALLLGARALAGRDPTRDGATRVLGVFGMHAGVLAVAAVAGAQIGDWGAFRTPTEAFWAFAVAHGLLALAFYAIGFLASALLARGALVAALAAWLFLVQFYDDLVELFVMRQIGLPGIQAGAFPAWFYVAQALSPLSAYRGILILWREDFRDYIESRVLGGADLPAWMNPGTFAALMVVLWVLLPLVLALVAWRVRGWLAARAGADEPKPYRGALASSARPHAGRR